MIDRSAEKRIRRALQAGTDAALRASDEWMGSVIRLLAATHGSRSSASTLCMGVSTGVKEELTIMHEESHRRLMRVVRPFEPGRTFLGESESNSKESPNGRA